MKRTVIDVPQIRAAMEELYTFAKARAAFNNRVAEEEAFYRLRVQPIAHKGEAGERFAPRSAWLLNSVMQKHADMMEYMPTATCLAREPSDTADAAALSKILPVILERNGFESTYSDNMWYKLKHGVCAYGVFWNNATDNGIGDIDVRRVEMMNLYWQNGVRDLEDSRSVFMIEQTDAASLAARFPHFDGKGSPVDFFVAGEGTSTDQVMVVDWYYKKRLPDGRTVLHYCKFSGDNVLFASENEEGYENGWYEHGKYPFVLDVLYPIEGECTGFGVIAMARDPQTYIDRMDRNLLEYMDWATRVRFFCKKNTGVNEQDFSDLSRRIVEVEGDVDEERLRQIRVDELPAIWRELKNDKIDELKVTTFNRDIMQGQSSNGVVAASAIVALQAAGSKMMRDIVAASYRAFVRVAHLMIGCVRQFYSEERYFRILGEGEREEFIAFSNRNMLSGDRVPIFDIDVHAERKDPYTRVSQNEILRDLYALGVFEPENAEAASILLSAMEFAGIERVREQVKANLPRAATSGKSTARKKASGADLQKMMEARVETLRKSAEERL